MSLLAGSGSPDWRPYPSRIEAIEPHLLVLAWSGMPAAIEPRAAGYMTRDLVLRLARSDLATEGRERRMLIRRSDAPVILVRVTLPARR